MQMVDTHDFCSASEKIEIIKIAAIAVGMAAFATAAYGIPALQLGPGPGDLA